MKPNNSSWGFWIKLVRSNKNEWTLIELERLYGVNVNNKLTDLVNNRAIEKVNNTFQLPNFSRTTITLLQEVQTIANKFYELLVYIVPSHQSKRIGEEIPKKVEKKLFEILNADLISRNHEFSSLVKTEAENFRRLQDNSIVSDVSSNAENLLVQNILEIHSLFNDALDTCLSNVRSPLSQTDFEDNMSLLEAEPSADNSAVSEISQTSQTFKQFNSIISTPTESFTIKSTEIASFQKKMLNALEDALTTAIMHKITEFGDKVSTAIDRSFTGSNEVLDNLPQQLASKIKKSEQATQAVVDDLITSVFTENKLLFKKFASSLEILNDGVNETMANISQSIGQTQHYIEDNIVHSHKKLKNSIHEVKKMHNVAQSDLHSEILVLAQKIQIFSDDVIEEIKQGTITFESQFYYFLQSIQGNVKFSPNYLESTPEVVNFGQKMDSQLIEMKHAILKLLEKNSGFTRNEGALGFDNQLTELLLSFKQEIKNDLALVSNQLTLLKQGQEVIINQQLEVIFTQFHSGIQQVMKIFEVNVQNKQNEISDSLDEIKKNLIKNLKNTNKFVDASINEVLAKLELLRKHDNQKTFKENLNRVSSIHEVLVSLIRTIHEQTELSSSKLDKQTISSKALLSKETGALYLEILENIRVGVIESKTKFLQDTENCKTGIYEDGKKVVVSVDKEIQEKVAYLIKEFTQLLENFSDS